MLRELYPQEGLLIGKGGGQPWDRGDRVCLPLKGPQAMVLEIVPAGQLPRPVLLGATGQARLEGDRLVLAGVAGEVGTKAEVGVLLPAGAAVRSLGLNGSAPKAFQRHGDVVTLGVAFAGTPFGHCQQIGSYDPLFAGKTFSAEFSIPARVAAQLARRRQDWPVPYTQDDLLCTWLGCDRLLLYVHIADPDDKTTVGMTIDGKAVEVKKAYSAIYPHSRERTFVGFYADVSSLRPDSGHRLEVTLPPLQPGQLQGVFFENVEAEFTTEIAP